MTELLSQLFGDAQDLVVLLRSDRCVEAANPAFLEGVRGSRVGGDFMRSVPVHARDRVLSELVRAAAGDEVLVEVPHIGDDGEPVGVEYRFFPVEGGRVAGIGRQRAMEPTDREALDRARAELRAKSRMLDEIQLELTQVPFIDPVTGVWNRMQVFERLASEWSRCERYGHPVSLLLVDVEALPAIRATEGPEHADRVLKAVARRVKMIARDHDIVGRYADNTLVVVAVQSGRKGAESLSRRLREGISSEPISLDQRTTRVTIRIGGAHNGSDGVEILEDLFQVAESALEEARMMDERIRVAHSSTA